MPFDAPELLRGAGLRVTEPRLAVVKALADNPHASEDVVHAAVLQDLEDVSHQTIYNVLNDLTANGLARRIEPADHPAHYELRVGDNHHHVVCSNCGAIADVDCVVGEAPCLTPGTDHGFVVTSAEVTFWGMCPSCQQEPRKGKPS